MDLVSCLRNMLIHCWSCQGPGGQIMERINEMRRDTKGVKGRGGIGQGPAWMGNGKGRIKSELGLLSLKKQRLAGERLRRFLGRREWRKKVPYCENF